MNEYYDECELHRYKVVQKMAYDAVLEVEGSLRPGMTEKDAAELVGESLRQKGADHFFHYPFAWFGDRTRFRNMKRPLDFTRIDLPHFGFDFLPSYRRLEEGMPVILDVAPIVEGRSADIGYAFSYGEHPAMHQARIDLQHFRPLILNGVLAGKTLGKIYLECDELIHSMGYENAHAKYPLGVIGHKVGRVPMQLPGFRFMGFDTRTFAYLLAQKSREIFTGGGSTFWEDSTDRIADAGLWAVEPHMGKDDFGVKWEEILVVTESTAYWLDDDLPHIRYWEKHDPASVKARQGVVSR